MKKLTAETIASGCWRSATFQAGVEYYRSGLVEDVRVDDVEGLFAAYVQGTWRYRTQARLSPEGDVLDVACQCPAYSSYYGNCKHIVALLLTIRDQFGDWDPRLARAVLVADNMFSLLPEFRPAEGNSEQLIVQPVLKYVHSRYQTRYSLGLRIGLTRLYVVKDVGELANAYVHGQPLYYGKDFTYDPRIHSFAAADQELVQLAAEVLDLNMLARERGAGAGSKKEVQFAASMLPRFLGLLKERFFTIEVNGRVFEDAQIREEELPVEVTVSARGQELELALDVLADAVPLDEQGNYMFYLGNVYQLSPEQRAIIPALFYGASQFQDRRVLIPTGHRSRFASELLPLLQKGAVVQIDGELESVFYREPLTAKLWLDTWQEGISAKLEYSYGEHKFNPLVGAPELPNGQILVRDQQTEQQIMGLLEQAQFTVLGQELHMEADEQVFSFVVDLMPRLQRLCEVYYSDALAAKRLVLSPRVRGRLGLNSDTNMLEFDFDMEGIERLELADVLASLREKKRYHRLRNGTLLNLAGGELADVGQLLDGLNLSRKELEQDVLELPRYRALAFDSYFRDGKLKSVSRSPDMRSFIQMVREAGETEYALPDTLTASLRDYQVTGYRWLRSLSACKLGGILADEMGLGKTVQMIALLAAERGLSGEPALVVAPTSLVYNWQDELTRFAPLLKVQLIVGSKAERKELLANLGSADLAITSYALLRRDMDLYRGSTFSHCILDEAQYIKNPGSLTAQAARNLQARRYFALTGTPIENSLAELWSVFEFLMPGFFGSHQAFLTRYAKAVESGDSVQAQRLAARVSPFVLRRVKDDVLPELPPKTEQKMLSELTRDQKKIYLAWLEKIRGEAAIAIKQEGFDKSRVKILAGLMRLRQICCHPSLFVEDYQGGSGKLDQLREVVRDSIASGHRLLIFSQFTGMLKMIREALAAEGQELFYLDGSTPAPDRVAMARAFNNGQGDVFLVSLKAGGTGLNLTGADMVIHYDLWWNPAVEDQASDRAHRIGQTRAVQVQKFIAIGTIDEKIYELQQKKKELFDSVIKPGEQLLTSLGEEQVREILGL